MAHPSLIPPGRLQEALAYMESVDPEPRHARQVHRLMRSLLLSGKELHQFTPAQIILAESAAFLHDIGWSRSAQDRGKAHHKHSAAMIRERTWTHFSPAEAELTAQIARYHRKKLPGVKHREFILLSEGEQLFVSKAAAFLRIADALDRAHRNLVATARLEKIAGQWTVIAGSQAACEEESYGFDKKKDLFERTFHCSLSLLKRPD